MCELFGTGATYIRGTHDFNKIFIFFPTICFRRALEISPSSRSPSSVSMKRSARKIPQSPKSISMLLNQSLPFVDLASLGVPLVGSGVIERR